MKKIVFFAALSVLVGCASSSDSTESRPTEFNKKHPVVTIETSGDLYYEENGQNIQMDLFGNCAPGQSVIYVEIDMKKSVTQCRKGRYRYSMNLPDTFFQTKYGRARGPSGNYVMKSVKAYHEGHKKLNATSYILIDRRKREVKSVINKQVKFERIPTGEYEPITQFNAFGSCTAGSVLKLDITAPDRYGHEVSKYDEKKECQDSGGFYFLSQIHGYPKKGTLVYVYEDQKDQSQRRPASQSKPRYKNLFKWSVPVE
jgi:hypothetical protein